MSTANITPATPPLSRPKRHMDHENVRQVDDVFNSMGIKQLEQFIAPTTLERDMAQWLESGALSMSLPAVQFRVPLGA